MVQTMKITMTKKLRKEKQADERSYSRVVLEESH